MIDERARVRAELVLDVDRLSSWMESEGLGSGPIEDPLVLTGGTQNLLVRFRFAGRDLVLRRPPLTPRPKNNALILREATVLRALANTAVPHAALAATCSDESVLGSAVFYVMEAVTGFNPAEELPAEMDTDEGREHLSLKATDALADIGSLDYEASTIGDPLMDLGRYIAMWPDEHEVIIDTGAIWEAGPLPSPDALVERYIQRSGSDIDHLPWYVIMGCFKLGLILEGTYARSCAGLAPKHLGVLMHKTSVRLFQRAARLIGATR